jgi:hypothetical protein
MWLSLAPAIPVPQFCCFNLPVICRFAFTVLQWWSSWCQSIFSCNITLKNPIGSLSQPSRQDVIYQYHCILNIPDNIAEITTCPTQQEPFCHFLSFKMFEWDLKGWCCTHSATSHEAYSVPVPNESIFSNSRIARVLNTCREYPVNQIITILQNA